MSENDLSIIYYTCNVAPESFTEKTRANLLEVSKGIQIISVSHKPMDFGTNIVFKGERSHLNIYRQALIGAKEAKTKFIALTEDDVLYTQEHFKYRPTKRVFAYNMAVWALYTWNPDLFSYKDRINLSGLICERDLFIEAMEERFAKIDETTLNLGNFAEPGKYEKNLGVAIRDIEKFYTDIPNIAFSHPTALSFENLGKRKRMGDLKVTALPYWGSASEVSKIYV